MSLPNVRDDFHFLTCPRGVSSGEVVEKNESRRGRSGETFRDSVFYADSEYVFASLWDITSPMGIGPAL